jgi:hypothetical protein
MLTRSGSDPEDLLSLSMIQIIRWFFCVKVHGLNPKPRVPDFYLQAVLADPVHFDRIRPLNKDRIRFRIPDPT